MGQQFRIYNKSKNLYLAFASTDIKPLTDGKIAFVSVLSADVLNSADYASVWTFQSRTDGTSTGLIFTRFQGTYFGLCPIGYTGPNEELSILAATDQNVNWLKFTAEIDKNNNNAIINSSEGSFYLYTSGLQNTHIPCLNKEIQNTTDWEMIGI